MPPPPQISQWIRRAYPKPRVDDDWLDACCTWTADELRLDPATQTQEFISNVETQLLESNLCDSMVEGTGLPMNALTMNNERIHGPPVLVEVTAITEIGHSAFNLQNVRQTRIERADLAGLALEEGGENDEGPIPNYPRTMLRLEVCDGSVTIPAIEYREIPDLKLGESPLGFKILLKDVLVRRGILFLEPRGIELKGHRTEDRDEFQDRDFVRGLCRRLGKPPPLDEEQVGGEENPHAPSATLVPPANRHVPAARPEQMLIRSPLREISEPPEPRPDDMDLDDEADLPRRRRIPNPNPNRNLPTASGSSTKTSTLVTSHFFAGDEGPSTVSTTASATEVLSRALSPVRGARIDVDIDIDAGVDDFEGTSRSRRSATAAGKQRQVTSAKRSSNTISNANTGDGSGSVARNNSEEFDFGSDADIDAAFLDEVEKVEKAALENSQMQSKAVSQTHAQVQLDRPAGGRMRTPVPAPATRRMQSQLPAQAVSHMQPPVSSQPRAHSQRPQTQTQLRTRPVPQDVITIEDDEEDDKENVPVPRRRVRRRISTTPDDVVIDLSD